MVWRLAVGLAILAVLGGAGCEPALPDPESAGAQLYGQRCRGCHRLYAPQAMTTEMWRVQVERMQREFARRGLPALTPGEADVLLAYLGTYSSDGRVAPGQAGAPPGAVEK